MKKLTMLKMVSAACLLATGLTAHAGVLFASDVIRCGASGSSAGCGSNSPASHSLVDGMLTVSTTGEVSVTLRGAPVNTSYTVFVGNWVRNGGWQSEFNGSVSECGVWPIGYVRTNGSGYFSGAVTLANGTAFAFPANTNIGQLNFAFNQTGACYSQFTTGLKL